MKQAEFVMVIGAVAFCALPALVAQAYFDRGYFAIGGEWFVPVLAMLVAYIAYELKGWLADWFVLVYAVTWLYIIVPLWKIFKKSMRHFALFILKTLDK